ncbi:MAG: sigma-70 family RNA polymerase sigma factor [Sedimentisphaerales bacterium]|nr:sigma-70 family RNA polymerase sigma factor [Sedimentisphaerales bacterium]
MDQDKKTEEITLYWTQSQSIVAAFISSAIPNFEDANDVLQNVAMAIVRSFDKYNKQIPFTAWAIGIARNEILHYYRKIGRDKHIFDDELVQKIAQVYQEKAADLHDIKKALDQCLNKIQGRWKEILQLRYLRGMDARRIGQNIGISQNAVFILLHRIRTSLRECVDRTLQINETGRHG